MNIQQDFDRIAEWMRLQARLHYSLTEDELITRRKEWFQRSLTTLTQRERDYWFQDSVPTREQDLRSLPVRTPDDLLQTQELAPPFGLFNDRPGALIKCSSGTTGQRKRWPRTWPQWQELCIGNHRQLVAMGVQPGDAIMTTEIGKMQQGNQVMEDPAALYEGVLKVQCIKAHITDQLSHIERYGVNVISGIPHTLLLWAKRWHTVSLQRPLRAVATTGAPLTHEDRQRLCEAFDVERIYDHYGSSEMSNIWWTCAEGARHVNVDLMWIDNDHFADTSVISSYCGLPYYRYSLQERIDMQPSECACGSALPICTTFTQPDKADSFNWQIKG